MLPSLSESMSEHICHCSAQVVELLAFVFSIGKFALGALIFTDGEFKHCMITTTRNVSCSTWQLFTIAETLLLKKGGCHDWF
mmetsp:Transcript_61122/g.111950  ORF Transcript_61122/g.111950 Transcript_61122/m.111950 type:complete len:82 (-) Transcript_61122:828-1073(-)